MAITRGQLTVVGPESAVELLFQYSVDGSSNWHTVFVEGDLYFRVSSDGGVSWSEPARFAGPSGVSTYVHLAYANSADGSVGFSTSISTGKTYLGQFVSTSSTPSQVYSDYKWQKFVGEDGKGIVSTTVGYQLHTSGTTPPTGTWLTDPPTPIQGRYSWTRTITTYTSGDPVTTYSVAYLATNGQNGADGKGITSTVIEYAQTLSGATTPSSWSSTRPSPEKGQYLWTKTTISYSDSTDSVAYNISYSATDGQKGDKGDKGEPGRSITSVDVQYAKNSSTTSAPTTGWSTTAPVWENGKYIWSKTVTTYSTGNPTESTPVCITGQKGSTGSTGRGVSSIVEQFYLSTSKTTQIGGSWSTAMPTWEPGKYVWTRSLITYTSGTPPTSTTEPLVSSEWEAVNEVEIGGTNLVPHSMEFKKGSAAAGLSSSITSEGYLRIIADAGNSGYVNSFHGLRTNLTKIESAFNEGDRFTISFMVKSEDATLPPAIYIKPGMGYYDMVGSVSPEFSTISYTGSWKKLNSISLHLRFTGRVGTYIFKAWKIEKGNKATNWSPAPEDIYENLSTPNATVISGNNITTGTVDANRVNVINLDASNIISGTIDAGEIDVINLDASNITAGVIDAKMVRLSDFTSLDTKISEYEAGKITLRSLTPGNNLAPDTSPTDTEITFNSRHYFDTIPVGVQGYLKPGDRISGSIVVTVTDTMAVMGFEFTTPDGDLEEFGQGSVYPGPGNTGALTFTTSIPAGTTGVRMFLMFFAQGVPVTSTLSYRELIICKGDQILPWEPYTGRSVYIGADQGIKISKQGFEIRMNLDEPLSIYSEGQFKSGFRSVDLGGTPIEGFVSNIVSNDPDLIKYGSVGFSPFGHGFTVWDRSLQTDPVLSLEAGSDGGAMLIDANRVPRFHAYPGGSVILRDEAGDPRLDLGDSIDMFDSGGTKRFSLGNEFYIQGANGVKVLEQSYDGRFWVRRSSGHPAIFVSDLYTNMSSPNGNTVINLSDNFIDVHNGVSGPRIEMFENSIHIGASSASQTLILDAAKINEINNISSLNRQIRGTLSIQGFNCNIRDQYFRIVSLYQGVNAPVGNIGVLMHIPYTEDWIVQIFLDTQTDSSWERKFRYGTTWTEWSYMPNGADLSNLRSRMTTAESHMTESAQKHIRESGSNGNGEYIKFDDGTMICYHHTYLSNLSIGSGATYTSPPFPYPAAFPSTVTRTYGGYVTNLGGGRFSVPLVDDAPTGHHGSQAWGFSLINRSGETLVKILSLSLFAIGRWK